MARPYSWLTPPIRLFPFRHLLAIPILLAIATSLTLFAHSSVDMALLWSQCHSHARIPGLSRLPLLGTPACFLVSFFQSALDSLRTRAVMAVVLAYVGGLATVCNVEAARACNRPSGLVARPAMVWLLFNLLGGAVVWQLVIVPAFLHRARTLFLVVANDGDDGGHGGHGHGHGHGDNQEQLQLAREPGRTLPDSEVVAIPIAIAVGYVLPSVLMLAYNSPAAISVWLFFPVSVSLVRQAVRRLVDRVRRAGPASIHFESHPQCVALVYALPVLLSALAHVFLLWNLAVGDDDRKKMTRLAVRFIEIDLQFVAWTVLYWVFVEAGLRLPLAMVGLSVVAGPGAGTCLGWLYREKLVQHGFGHEVRGNSSSSPAGEEEDSRPEEATPLLR